MKTDSFNRTQYAIRAAYEAILSVEAIPESTWQSAYSILGNREGKIVLTGVGKSGYVAMKIAATLTSLGHLAVFIHPVEALHGDIGGVGVGDCIVALSFSGNTKEVIHFLLQAKKTFDVSVIGITRSSDSNLSNLADIVLPVTITDEGCPLNLAPMASTTAMLVVGDALSAGLTSPTQFTKRDFVRFHPGGTLGLALTLVRERMIHNTLMLLTKRTPLPEVLSRMGEVGKGLLGVVDEQGVLEGGITDGDIRRFFTHNQDSEGVEAQHVMSFDPKRITETHTLEEALVLMEVHKITNLFVVNSEGVPIGIIHMHDILNSHETGR